MNFKTFTLKQDKLLSLKSNFRNNNIENISVTDNDVNNDGITFKASELNTNGDKSYYEYWLDGIKKDNYNNYDELNDLQTDYTTTFGNEYGMYYGNEYTVETSLYLRVNSTTKKIEGYIKFLNHYFTYNKPYYLLKISDDFEASLSNNEEWSIVLTYCNETPFFLDDDSDDDKLIGIGIMIPFVKSNITNTWVSYFNPILNAELFDTFFYYRKFGVAINREEEIKTAFYNANNNGDNFINISLNDVNLIVNGSTFEFTEVNLETFSNDPDVPSTLDNSLITKEGTKILASKYLPIANNLSDNETYKEIFIETVPSTMYLLLEKKNSVTSLKIIMEEKIDHVIKYTNDTIFNEADFISAEESYNLKKVVIDITNNLENESVDKYWALSFIVWADTYKNSAYMYLYDSQSDTLTYTNNDANDLCNFYKQYFSISDYSG